MTPHTHSNRADHAGTRPHGRRCVGVVFIALMAFLFTNSAEAQRRPQKKPAKTAPRSGPKDPTQSDLANPGAAKKDGPKSTKAKVRTKGSKSSKTQVFDFTGLSLSGSERKPQLLYFLDRAKEELKRASLERRSFVPEMVRSIDEEAL